MLHYFFLSFLFLFQTNNIQKKLKGHINKEKSVQMFFFFLSKKNPNEKLSHDGVRKYVKSRHRYLASCEFNIELKT